MDELKNEEKRIKEYKIIERRINDFSYNLNEDRYVADIERKLRLKKLKVIDKRLNSN
jgi:hypothetical protein